MEGESLMDCLRGAAKMFREYADKFDGYVQKELEGETPGRHNSDGNIEGERYVEDIDDAVGKAVKVIKLSL